MTRKFFFFLFFVLFLLLIKTNSVYADSGHEAYVTIVNPVREKSFWKNTAALSDQINIIAKKNLPATWLLQYSLLNDADSLEILKNLPKNHEIGLFLEIDQSLADDALVPYLIGEGDWARPDKLLTSGYTPDERKRMIDYAFTRFKEIFGYYPATVGAWYIDAFSLGFMEDKYKITANLTVADQYQTDKYGLWGQPWGIPYYPSKTNPLIPAETGDNKIDIVTIQWAQRDPVRGYGLNVADSTYSVQANDYIAHHKLTTDYFRHLSNIYLFPPNPLNQLTVGLEVGQEGVTYSEEFRRQIAALVNLNNANRIEFVTVSEFAKKFKNQYPASSPNYIINGKDVDSADIEALWYSSSFYRIGLIKDKKDVIIRDFRIYDDNLLLLDVFDKDTNQKLQRIVPPVIDGLISRNSKVLITDIKKQEVKRDGEDIILVLMDERNKEHKLILRSESVVFDGKTIIRINRKETLAEKTKNKLIKLLLRFQLNSDYRWKGSYRFSQINNAYYLGLWVSPNRLIGIKTGSPYIGSFDFPFQVLVRFKTIPQVNWFSMVSAYFVNYFNHSTIKGILEI